MPKTPKKIRFAPNDYKSETVFSNLSSGSKRERPKKRRKQVSTDEDYEPRNTFFHSLNSRKPTPYKINGSKKRKLVISYSNDSFQEDLMYDISPTKSEAGNANGTNIFKKEESPIEITSDSEESNNSFSFTNFFHTRDHSLNESITEAHSGIDYEFISDGIKKVKICGKRMFDLKSNDSSDAPSTTQMSVESIDPKQIEDKFGENVEIPITHESVQVDCYESTDSIVENYPQDVPEIERTFSEDLDHFDSSTNSIGISRTEPESIDEFSSTPERHTETRIDKYFEIKHEQMVLLRENCSLCFFGLFKLKVLHGTVEVLGYVLDKHSKEINVYSPRGSALLTIKNITVQGEEGSLHDIFPNLKKRKCPKDLVEKKTTAVLRYSTLDDGCLKCTEKYISQQIFPKIDDIGLPRVIFEPDNDFNVVSESPLWDEVLKNVSTSSKLLVAGGKGVGKSTFVRYAINRLLNHFEKIRVIDLDPGQPEFTVPGCISVLAVTEPVCGPNYTHLRKTERSYLSNIDVGCHRSMYLKNIKLLMTELDTRQNIPTVINYMGYSQGSEGLDIVSSVITHVLPTDVVQISSQTSNKNFIKDLSSFTVGEICKSKGMDPPILRFNLHKLTSMSDNNNSGWTLAPRQAREMCALSYFGQMMHNGISSLLSCKLPTYGVGLDSIKIVDGDGSEISPAAVIGNLVALCSREDSSKIFRCMGYGIVRAIDTTNAALLLITPEPPDVLDEVFYLVMNGVNIPPSVLMLQGGYTGSIPYVVEGEFEGLAQITKRCYIPASKK